MQQRDLRTEAQATIQGPRMAARVSISEVMIRLIA